MTNVKSLAELKNLQRIVAMCDKIEKTTKLLEAREAELTDFMRSADWLSLSAFEKELVTEQLHEIKDFHRQFDRDIENHLNDSIARFERLDQLRLRLEQEGGES